MFDHGLKPNGGAQSQLLVEMRRSWMLGLGIIAETGRGRMLSLGL